LDLWAYQRGVTLDFSRPGKPTDNAFIEALTFVPCTGEHRIVGDTVLDAELAEPASWEHFISVYRAAVVSSSQMNLEPARQNVWSALRKRVILSQAGPVRTAALDVIPAGRTGGR
jgi:hypothetical protein